MPLALAQAPPPANEGFRSRQKSKALKAVKREARSRSKGEDDERPAQTGSDLHRHRHHYQPSSPDPFQQKKTRRTEKFGGGVATGAVHDIDAAAKERPFNLADLVAHRTPPDAGHLAPRKHRDVCGRGWTAKPYEGGDVTNLAIARTGSESLRDALVHNSQPAHHNHDCTLRRVADKGAARVVVSVRHPLARIVSGYQRRVEGNSLAKGANQDFVEYFGTLRWRQTYATLVQRRKPPPPPQQQQDSSGSPAPPPAPAQKDEEGDGYFPGAMPLSGLDLFLTAYVHDE